MRRLTVPHPAWAFLHSLHNSYRMMGTYSGRSSSSPSMEKSGLDRINDSALDRHEGDSYQRPSLSSLVAAFRDISAATVEQRGSGSQVTSDARSSAASSSQSLQPSTSTTRIRETGSGGGGREEIKQRGPAASGNGRETHTGRRQTDRGFRRRGSSASPQLEVKITSASSEVISQLKTYQDHSDAAVVDDARRRRRFHSEKDVPAVLELARRVRADDAKRQHGARPSSAMRFATKEDVLLFFSSNNKAMGAQHHLHLPWNLPDNAEGSSKPTMGDGVDWVSEYVSSMMARLACVACDLTPTEAIDTLHSLHILDAAFNADIHETLLSVAIEGLADTQQVAPSGFSLFLETLNQFNMVQGATSKGINTALGLCHSDYLKVIDALTKRLEESPNSFTAVQGGWVLHALRRVGHLQPRTVSALDALIIDVAKHRSMAHFAVSFVVAHNQTLPSRDALQAIMAHVRCEVGAAEGAEAKAEGEGGMKPMALPQFEQILQFLKLIAQWQQIEKAAGRESFVTESDRAMARRAVRRAAIGQTSMSLSMAPTGMKSSALVALLSLNLAREGPLAARLIADLLPSAGFIKKRYGLSLVNVLSRHGLLQVRRQGRGQHDHQGRPSVSFDRHVWQNVVNSGFLKSTAMHERLQEALRQDPLQKPTRSAPSHQEVAENKKAEPTYGEAAAAPAATEDAIEIWEL